MSGSAIQTVGDQQRIRALQVGIVEADDQTHFADGRDMYTQSEDIVGASTNRKWLVGVLWNQRHEVASLNLDFAR